MKMLSANFLLPFLCAAHALHDISKGDTGNFFSNLKESSVDENEILSMIEQQATLCPYIHLCNNTNRSTSTFIPNKAGGYPCCSECSCHVSCIAEGTCCPDFVYIESEVEVESVKQKEAETITNGMSCVRTHYGVFNKNNDGYQMIASCPDNFTNQPIKQRCESNIHIKDTETLVDVIPIFHKESAMSYKNIFCYMCNKAAKNDINDGIVKPAKFWDSRVYCMSEVRPFLHATLDPLEFGKGLLQFECNIIFYNSCGTENGSKLCKFDDIVKSCKSEYVATKLEMQCKHYGKWPITSSPIGSAYKTETFKNYACMLCNGRTFSENCIQYTPDSSLLSIFLTKTEPDFVANLIENKPEKSYSDMIYINQTIDKYFPDSNGNIPCGKGFILDKETNECRQVFCPDNFLLYNGSCFPMIDKTEGLFYYHLFQVIVPATLNIEVADAFEDALVKASEKLLNNLIGAGKYNLTLWSNDHELIKMNKKYFVSLILHDKYADGNYIEILTFFYKLGTAGLQLEIVEENISKKFFEVKFRLTMNFKLQTNVFVGISGEVLNPRRPFSFSTKRNIFQVTKSLLCYRIGMAISETDSTKSRVSLFVKSTKTIISFPNFQRLKSEFEVRFLVCLEYALNDIVSTNKYTFDEYPSKNVTSRMDLKHRESRPDYDEYANDIEVENDAHLYERSIVTLFVTLVVVCFVVGSRILLKRLTNR